MLEDYLPFNDRNLLGPEVYFKVLEYHLSQQNYRKFCERIHRWPVVYPLEKMILLTKAEVKSWVKETPKLEGKEELGSLFAFLLKAVFTFLVLL